MNYRSFSVCCCYVNSLRTSKLNSIALFSLFFWCHTFEKFANCWVYFVNALFYNLVGIYIPSFPFDCVIEEGVMLSSSKIESSLSTCLWFGGFSSSFSSFSNIDILVVVVVVIVVCESLSYRNLRNINPKKMLHTLSLLRYSSNPFTTSFNSVWSVPRFVSRSPWNFITSPMIKELPKNNTDSK